MKNLLFSFTAVCLLPALATSNAKATLLYFDPAGANPVTDGTYTWDTVTSQWATSSTLTGSTVAWNSADAAVFTAGSYTGNITVDVASGGITLPGLFNGSLTPPGCNLTIAGPGALNWSSGNDGLSTGGSDGGTTTITAVMTGPGTIVLEASQSVYLYAANTYTGGTKFNGNGGVNFNNNASFGTGAITFDRTASQMVLASQGSAPLTIANNVVGLAGSTLAYAGGATAPTTFSGNWTLPASGTTQTIQVDTGTPMTISGVIGGAGNLSLIGNGNMVLKGANTYSGTTTIGGTAKLTLAVGNTIAGSSSVSMSGGTLDLGGNQHSMLNTTLSLASSSTIDFHDGGTAAFADSSLATWASGAILDLVNYTSGDMSVGTSASGLTPEDVSKIEINGVSGVAEINNAGQIVVVPEPSVIALGTMGALGLLARRILKRKNA